MVPSLSSRPVIGEPQLVPNSPIPLPAKIDDALTLVHDYYDQVAKIANDGFSRVSRFIPDPVPPWMLVADARYSAGLTNLYAPELNPSSPALDRVIEPTAEGILDSLGAAKDLGLFALAIAVSLWVAWE